MPTWIAKAFASAALAVSLLLVADSLNGLAHPAAEMTVNAAPTGR